MKESLFKYATPVVYWILVIIWSYIFIFYFKKIGRKDKNDKLLKLLLLILAIDAFRTLFESMYFGVWYTSLAGLIPKGFFNFLAKPQIVFFPKIINLITAVLVLVMLIKKWLPSEIKQKENINDLIEKQISELSKTNQELIIAKEKSEESEERFRALHNASFGGIAIHDKGFILECNQELSKISGFSKDELIGGDGVELLIAQESRETVRNNIRSGFEKSYEVLGLRKNGEKYPVRLEAKQIPYKGKNVRSVEFRDITERKRLEVDQIKQKALLEAVFNGIPDAIVYTNVNREIIGINHSFTSIFGFTFDDLAGKETSYIYEDHEEFEKQGRIRFNLNAEELALPYQVKYRKKDGSVFIGETLGTKIIDLNGTSIGFLGLIRDITERKQAEDKTEQQKKVLDKFFEQPMNLHLIADLDGTIKRVNVGFKKILGYEPHKLIKSNFLDLVHPDDRSTTIEEMEKLSKGQTTFYFENRYRHKNGSWRLLAWSALASLEDSIIYAVSSDITERKQAETELLKLSAAVQQSPSVIAITDTNGSLQYVNPKFTEITGYSLDEVIGKNPRILKSGEQSDEMYKELWETILSGKTWRGEIHNKKKNGKLFWEMASISSILDKQGNIINYIKVAEDITSKKKTEQKLIIAKEKAEESDRLKSAFLANMSHEIRTPMNGVLGFVELLKEPQLTGDKKDKYIDIIEKSGKRLLKTINDIIDISKIEVGEVKVSKSEVLVNEILKEQYNFFYEEAKSKGIELIYKSSLSDSEARFVTDKYKLEGILINLIKNAIKYTKTGKIIMDCRLKDKADGKLIEFYIEDTGIGIPQNRIHAIFNHFEQADIEDKGVFEGSGLGLAIVKSYVEMLGGKINVKSVEGEGSTFTFSLPYNMHILKESVATQNKKEELGVSLNNLSVIVAEDDEISRMFLETILKNHVKRLTYTTTGKETIEKFRKNPDTDIILMDIKMAEMNGYDATREIRKFNSDVIIIAQTAFGLAGEREKAIEAGCNDYISKPIKKEILFEKILTCLDKKNH